MQKMTDYALCEEGGKYGQREKKERIQLKQASWHLITLNSCDISTVKDAELGLVESERKAKEWIGRRCRRK